eukprot:TRINITY_DN27764_c0_g1_i1.p3 TRINITY_DN27764_c0_g1~~TRINITY_DN27764_c0_g1_i1.p3  ORF type:complete len:102 (+),score=3.85 TRINITY_DN27764_c0_g1_i1:789-1094(+)
MTAADDIEVLLFSQATLSILSSPWPHFWRCILVLQSRSTLGRLGAGRIQFGASTSNGFVPEGDILFIRFSMFKTHLVWVRAFDSECMRSNPLFVKRIKLLC